MSDFKDVLSGLLTRIDTQGQVTLATSEEDHVTARIVSIVVYDGKIAFQTSSNLKKFKQLQENPNCAFSFGEVQIIGTAEIKGLASEDKKFQEIYKQKYPKPFIDFDKMTTSHVIEVTPKIARLWTHELNEPYLMTIDAVTQEISLEPYEQADDHWDFVKP